MLSEKTRVTVKLNEKGFDDSKKCTTITTFLIIY